VCAYVYVLMPHTSQNRSTFVCMSLDSHEGDKSFAHSSTLPFFPSFALSLLCVAQSAPLFLHRVGTLSSAAHAERARKIGEED